MDSQKENVLGMREMAVPMFAGILSAFRRVITRRISIKVSIYIIIAKFLFSQFIIVS